MNFENEYRSILHFPINIKTRTSQNNASISDAETGELLFYTNGCVVTNSNHDIMLGGDSLNYTKIGYSLQADCQYGFFGTNSIILPDPYMDGGYYIFHKPAVEVEGYISSLGLPFLWSSYVNMQGDGGQGQVTYKNKPVLQTQNTLSGYNHAVKHANGTDWWLIQIEDTTNIYYKILINESGPHIADTQAIGPKYHPDSSSGGQAKFSPDGSQWALTNRHMGLMIFDFDRETGDLGALRRVPIMGDELLFNGLEWSPSGQFIYVSAVDTLYQIDTYEANLEDGVRVVGVWDGSGGIFATVFGFMMRGPDCRIYMSSYSSTKTIHVINNPDGLGPDCDFRQHGLDLLGVSTGTISIPNFPNFRLDIGPPCNPDITTTYDHTVFSLPEKLHLFPNPVSESFGLNIGKDIDGTLSIYDSSGNIIFNKFQNSGDVILADSLPKGMYIVRFVDLSGNAFLGKMVKL